MGPAPSSLLQPPPSPGGTTNQVHRPVYLPSVHSSLGAGLFSGKSVHSLSSVSHTQEAPRPPDWTSSFPHSLPRPQPPHSQPLNQQLGASVRTPTPSGGREPGDNLSHRRGTGELRTMSAGFRDNPQPRQREPPGGQGSSSSGCCPVGHCESS